MKGEKLKEEKAHLYFPSHLFLSNSYRLKKKYAQMHLALAPRVMSFSSADVVAERCSEKTLQLSEIYCMSIEIPKSGTAIQRFS